MIVVKAEAADSIIQNRLLGMKRALDSGPSAALLVCAITDENRFAGSTLENSNTVGKLSREEAASM